MKLSTLRERDLQTTKNLKDLGSDVTKKYVFRRSRIRRAKTNSPTSGISPNTMKHMELILLDLVKMNTVRENRFLLRHLKC